MVSMTNEELHSRACEDIIAHIRAAQVDMDRTRRRRDAAIMHACDELNLSARWVAKQIGMSHAGVNKIVTNRRGYLQYLEDNPQLLPANGGED